MKTPLVLLPGLLSNKSLWRHQSYHLNDIAEIYIIPTSQNTPQKMIQSILKKAPSKFALAGHSMGGWLCLEIMKAFPDRVSKLCLLNTTARMDSKEKKIKRENMISKAQNGFFEEVVHALVDNFVFSSFVKKDVRKMFLEVGETAFINQQTSMLRREDSQLILPNISCPTLVVHAAKDIIFSIEEHKELVAEIKGAKLAIIEDSAHMSPLEMPQAITAFLRFWLTYF
jgi:pimeloyl-ACP methyl ester carboxylesterase